MKWLNQGGPWGTGPSNENGGGGNTRNGGGSGGSGGGSGGGGSNGGGSGGGSGGGGRGQGPWGSDPFGTGGGKRPPSLDELLQRLQAWFAANNQGGGNRPRRPGGGWGGRFSGGNRTVITGAIVVAVGLWVASGVYRVDPQQVGLQMLFGRYVSEEGSGLHLWFPAPIGSVFKQTVTSTNMITLGEGAPVTVDTRGLIVEHPGEGMMLTGDQNIIDISFVVQWRVADAKAYLFNMAGVETTLRAAANSAMREVIGQAPLDFVMTDGRATVGSRAQKLLQKIMDSYGAGVTILDVKLQKADPPPEVIDAFNDVQRARQDHDRLQNEANTYRNDILPRAQGDSQKLIQEAEGYKQRVIKDAEGEAARFISVYNSYVGAKDVTGERLYLETMQQILSKSDKVLIDSKAGNGQGVIPYLPLPALQRTGGSPRVVTNDQGSQQ